MNGQKGFFTLASRHSLLYKAPPAVNGWHLLRVKGELAQLYLATAFFLALNRHLC
jgi:hypothetical protein